MISRLAGFSRIAPSLRWLVRRNQPVRDPDQPHVRFWALFLDRGGGTGRRPGLRCSVTVLCV